MLPSDFLEKYEAELGFIVLQNPDNRMGLGDIKARLAHIAGIESLTVEQSQGKEIYHLGEQTVEVPAGNAAVRNRVQFLAEGLKSVGPTALAKVDAAVSAMIPKSIVPKTEHKSMTLGIKPGSVKGILQKVRDEQNAALAKVGELAVKSQEVAGRLNSVADAGHKDLDSTLAELGEFTEIELPNGGPTIEPGQ